MWFSLKTHAHTHTLSVQTRGRVAKGTQLWHIGATSLRGRSYTALHSPPPRVKKRRHYVSIPRDVQLLIREDAKHFTVEECALYQHRWHEMDAMMHLDNCLHTV